MLQNIPVKKKILSQQWQYQSVTSASITSASVIAVLMVGSDDIISDSLSIPGAEGGGGRCHI